MKIQNSPNQLDSKTLHFVKPFLFIFLITISSFSFSQQIAFPGAEGFGKRATGGRGGSVIKVTNLNDSGAGSLRQALMYTTGPRTIVFEVGGTITLKSLIAIRNGDVTIAGQTAPGDGILIKGSELTVESSNVIIRYIRFRPGNSQHNAQDGLSIIAWRNDIVENIIIDHCSISWADDENFSMRASNSGIVKNITLQNSIISECGYGVLVSKRTYNKTFYKNLFAHNQERNIHSGFPTAGDYFDFEMINNLIYGFRWAVGSALGNKFTVLNNYFKKSSETEIKGAAVDATAAGQGTVSETYAFISGNVMPSGMDEYNRLLNGYIKSKSYLDSGIIAKNANQIEDDILSHVGASLPNRDAVDVRLINQYNNSNGKLASSGTYPTIQGGKARVDTDGDGMPDEWEIANGLDPNDPSDRNIVQPDGYTNLEYYLNGMTLQSSEVIANAGEDTEICKGNSTTLKATGGSTYLWSTGETTAHIEVDPSETTTYTVTAYDKTGNNSDSDEVIVTVNPLPKVNAGEDVSIEIGEKTTLTASGADSYLWSTGETTSSIEVSPMSTTTYKVTGTKNNCEASDTVTVFSVDASVKANAGEDTEICAGTSTTLTASGGTNYVWSTGETTKSIDVTPEATTTYTVTVSDDFGQSDEASVTVTVNDIPTANAGDDQTICNGETTTLTATGGTSYLWSTGQTTASIEVSPTTDTVYSVEVSTNGCSSTDDVSVFVKDAPVLSITGNLTIVEGKTTTLTVSGSDNYLWNTGGSTESITVSPEVTTTYSVSSNGPNGCSSNASVTVTVVQQVIANAGQDVDICAGSSTTLTATGGDAYLWSTGATSESIEVNPNTTTTYSVTVYDSTKTSSDTDEVVVTVNPLPIVDAGSGSTIDSGESVTLTATGATSYIWSTGATTASITVTPNATRTYTVTGTSNGCEATDTVKVTVRNTVEVIADAGADQSICAGSSATLTATGGSTYLWNTGATTASITISPSSTTTYSVTAFDSSGKFSDTDEVKVTVNALPAVDAGSNITINSGESATLTATGATSYKWSTGATSASITVSPTTTRTYTVTGTRNGCEVTDTVKVTVLNPVQVIANAGADQSICAGSSATLTATGGSTYLWSTGATTASITISPSTTTTYSVTAFDSTGKYSDTDEVKVTVNTVPTVSAGKNITITSGESTTLTASGATTYKWSTGATSASITVSPTATRTYTVTGTKNGCEATATVKVTVENPQVVVARAGGNKDICQGTPVTLTASGGDRYLWSTGEKTASITVNPKTTTKYSVTAYIGEASGTDEAVVTVSPKPNVTIINGSEAAILKGEFITLSAQGANRYKWSNGATQPNIAVRPTKTQTFDVVGYTNDCSSEKSIKVNVFEKIVADAGEDVAICLNESTVLTARGPANSEYLWSTGETTKSITVNPDKDTEYSVMVYHALDSDTDNVMVSVRNCESSQIVDDNEAIEDDTALEFLIHPNPTYGDVHIKISGMSNVSSIHLYDLSGKSLYNEEINTNDQQSYNKTLNLANFASGIYLLQLVDNLRVITKKIVLR